MSFDPAIMRTWEETQRLAGDPLVTEIEGKPAIRLPGDDKLISSFASEIAILLQAENIFVRNGCAFTVDFDGHRLEPISPDRLRTFVERNLICYRQSAGMRGTITLKRSMSKDIAAAVLAAPQFLEGLRRVEFFAPCCMPVLRPAGNLDLLRPGYDATSRIFTSPEAVEFSPYMELMEAKGTINDLLAEFPFAEDGGRSKAVAVAAMLTVFGIGVLPTGAARPVFLYLANAEGTGKTTLAKIAGIPYAPLAAQPAPCEETEWQKLLLAATMGGRRLLLFDNLKGHLNSSALEAYVTSSVYGGRVLGLSREFEGEAGAVILLTGNKLTISADMRRRALLCELFTPELCVESRQFRRTLDEPAIRELRPTVLAAMWALIREWDRAGRPPASRTNASFPRWCETIGGIVENAGFGCPITPAEITGMGDTDARDIARLAEYMDPGEPYTFADLVTTCTEHDLFERFTSDTEGEELTRKARKLLSQTLKLYDRRTIAQGLAFEIHGEGHTRRYSLERLVAQAPELT